MRRRTCALLALVVGVTGLVVFEPVAAAPDAGEPVGEPAEAVRSLPAAIVGEASVAPLPEGPGDVLREPPVAPRRPVEPVIAEPAARGFDAELSVEDVDQRDVFTTVFDNVDGTETAVFSSTAVNFATAAGTWEKIDPRLVPTGGDGVYSVSAAPWSASFSDAGVAIVGEAGTEVVLRPGAGGRLARPVVASDGLSATYVEAWPGVDLRFVVDNVSVRKELVLKRPGVAGDYEIVVEGLELEVGDGDALVVVGASRGDVVVGAPEVFDRDGAPINEVARPVQRARPVAAGEPGSVASAVTVSVDEGWLRTLAADEFPVVVDPVITVGAMSGYAYAFAGNGFTCPANPNCARPRVGNAMASGNTIWRSTFTYDYTSRLPTATVASKLVSASMNVSYHSGTTSSQAVSVRQASWWNWCGVHVDFDCSKPWMPIVDTTKWLTTGSVSFDVTSKLNEFWTQGAGALTWAFAGSETSGVYTFKEINASLSVTYDRLPVIGASGVSPANPHNFHDHLSGISLSVPAKTDPDGETLYYRFKLCPTASWTGCGSPWADSGWITSSSWNQWIGVGIPASWYDQQLYWGVQVSNLTSTNYTLNSSWLRHWKLYNNVAATPQPDSPAEGFTWTPHAPTELTFTTPDDYDGDWVRYRAVVRATGTSGVVYRSEWTEFIDPGPVNTHMTITLPTDAPLEPNQAYEWTVEFQDDTTYFHWYSFKGQPQGTPAVARQASFEARLGAGGPSPMQALGPVALNLATGNVTTSIATPQVPTLGGAMGLSMSYNTRARDVGLRSRLVNNTNNNFAADAGEQVSYQVDGRIEQQWVNPTAAPGISNLMSTWTGYITVPETATYRFAASLNSDEDVEVKIGSTHYLRVNRNASARIASPATIPFGEPLGETAATFYGRANVTTGSAGVMLTENQPTPITITYRNPTGAGQFGFYVYNNHPITPAFVSIPPSWLSPDARVLPRGWTLNHSEANGAIYSSAKITANEVVLTLTDGSTVAYTRNGNAYKPPPGEDDIVTVTAGKVTVTDTAGYVHQFHSSGQLETVTAPIDATTPAAPTPSWTAWTPTGSTPTQRLTAQTDPVSGREVLYTYQDLGTCPTATGFTTPDPGMLCKITYPDNTHTDLLYVELDTGEKVLSRVIDPGDEIYDIGYENVNLNGYTVPMMSSFRDPLVNDLIAYPTSGVTDSVDYQTTVTYDSHGRASTVTGPKASTAAAGRQKVTAVYKEVAGVPANETWLLVDGLDGPGELDWDRKVTFDDTARVEYDYQALNDAATQFSLTETRWHGLIDRPEVTITDGYATTNIFNHRNELVDTYGPARVACFDLTIPSSSYKLPNGTCTTPPVPRTTSEYDTTLNGDGSSSPWTGLGTSWWNNTTGEGKPANRTTGPGTNPTFVYDWGAGKPAAVTANDFAFRSDGEVWFPATGTWGFEIVTNADDTASLTIDGEQVVLKTTGTTATGTYTVTDDPTLKSGASHVRRVAVAFSDTSGNAKVTINWTPPGGSKVALPTSALRPAYSLATRTTVHDNSVDAPSHATHISYDTGGLDPAIGLVSQTVEDPAGLKLTHTNTYETGIYRRRVTRTLPAGNSYSYEYYTASGGGSTAAVNVGCTAQNDTTVHQGGNVRVTVSPANSAGVSIVSEKVYDDWGRTVATRAGTRTGGTDTWDPWSCVSYDSRGRATTVSVPANGVAPARTITNTYAVGGDPRVSSTGDASGTITTTVDIVGRGVGYQGLDGAMSVSAFDPVTGRLTSVTDTVGVHGYTYDRGGRLTVQTLNGDTIAQPTYGGPGGPDPHALQHVDYPSGAGNAGNGTRGSITRNTNGNTIWLAWTVVAGGATITSDAVVRSRSGRILDRSIDGADPHPAGNNYTYDGAGRVAVARVGGNVFQYGFAGTGGCGTAAAAGKNANRTSITINSSVAGTFCYDSADRLTAVSSSMAPFDDYTGAVGYDSHGNTTAIAGQELTYDAADRHLGTYHPDVSTATTSVVFERDVFDRIIRRTETTPGGTTVTRYGYTGAGDTPDLTMDAAGTVVETTMVLPGGALLTRSASDVWSYPDIHGSISATADDTGTKQGPTRVYDPDGNPLSGLPDNATGNFDYGWLGQHQRGVDHTPGLRPLMQMGARPYDPTLARFLEVDPIEGGNTNDYDYCSGDPIGCTDLDGRYAVSFEIGNWYTAESVMSVIRHSCSDLFPISGCANDFRLGQRLNLSQRVGPITQSFPVQVVGVSPTSFTLKSLNGHPEGEGRRIKFSISHRSGRTYLDVRTWGPGSIITRAPVIRTANDQVARRTWSAFASNLTNRLRSYYSAGFSRPI